MLRLDFSFNQAINAHVKSFSGMRWSRSHGCWYLPVNPGGKEALISYLATRGYRVHYEAQMQSAAKGPEPSSPAQVFNPLNRERLQRYRRYLEGLRMSPSTVNSYSFFINSFLKFIGERPLSEVDNTLVRHFVEELVAKKKYGISSHRQLIGAMKHFSDLFSESRISNLALVRPKRSRYLPTVLSQEEVMRLLQRTPNLKHRAALAMLYSAGLRISELLNLELRHIDLERRQLQIRQAKGRKDRYVVLAESMVPLLLNYINSYRLQRYFVEGDGGIRYSGSSVRAFLKRSCKRAGILKHVTPHTLRHSYATHLVENGVNLRHVQELLGHAKPETTMVYTHVARRDLLNIRSPLDEAVMKLLKIDNTPPHISLSGDF